MRVSPFLWNKDKKAAIWSTECSHNSIDSIIAVSKLYDLYNSNNKISGLIGNTFRKGFFINAYDTYQIIESLSLMTFNNMEDLVKFTIQLGGDTDTNASIVAELFNYREKNWITPTIKKYVEEHLDSYLLKILKDFNNEKTI